MWASEVRVESKLRANKGSLNRNHMFVSSGSHNEPNEAHLISHLAWCQLKEKIFWLSWHSVVTKNTSLIADASLGLNELFFLCRDTEWPSVVFYLVFLIKPILSVTCIAGRYSSLELGRPKFLRKLSKFWIFTNAIFFLFVTFPPYKN